MLFNPPPGFNEQTRPKVKVRSLFLFWCRADIIITLLQQIENLAENEEEFKKKQDEHAGWIWNTDLRKVERVESLNLGGLNYCSVKISYFDPMTCRWTCNQSLLTGFRLKMNFEAGWVGDLAVLVGFPFTYNSLLYLCCTLSHEVWLEKVFFSHMGFFNQVK